jgi:hypothetical protein
MRGAEKPGIVHRREINLSEAATRPQGGESVPPLNLSHYRHGRNGSTTVAGPNRKWTNCAPSEQMRYGVPVIFSTAKTIVTAIR